MTGAPRRRVAATVLLASSALVLAACGSSTSDVPRARQVTPDVAFTGCDVVACSDTLNGAAFTIELPTTWNGTLLLYSHGYRNAQPVPPNFDPVSTTAAAASDEETARTLLSQGYALAGSAYKSNGWAVADGVTAAEDLYAYFSQKIGTPFRTIVWGDSLGGLITQTIAEKHPEWVDGAAPLCGAVAGVVPNMNLALDVSFAVRTLLYPEMKLTGYATYEESVTTWTEAAKRVLAAASDTAGGGTAKVLYIAAISDAWLLPSNARRPVAISYRTQPSAQMSLRASASCGVSALRVARLSFAGCVASWIWRSFSIETWV